MNKKSLIYGLLIIITMISIFAFSAQPYEKTMATSDVIVEPMKDAIIEIQDKTFETEKEEKSYVKQLKSKLDKGVRKTAHMIMFGILAVFTYLFFKSLGFNDADAIILTLAFCAAYAGTDELHQRLVKGRTPQTIDICVDVFGSVISMIIVRICHKIRCRRKLAVTDGNNQ